MEKKSEIYGSLGVKQRVLTYNRVTTQYKDMDISREPDSNKNGGNAMSDRLDQNPTDKLCAECGDIADEFYDEQWLCLECIARRDIS
jgi:hypothetical protein